MIVLRPDQFALKQDIYTGWQQGNRAMLAVLPTGGGKSVIMTDVLNDMHALGARQIVAAHRNELVTQMSVHVARRGIKHRIIGSASTVAEATALHREEFNGRSFINPDANTAVASIGTIQSRKDALNSWFQGVDYYYGDECFPAGVMIQTPDGEKPIETIQIGDLVTSFNEKNGAMQYRKVLHLFKNPFPDTIVDIKTNMAHVRCTPAHPFWTDRGWIEAAKVTPDDRIFVYLHGMPDPVHIDLKTSSISFRENWSDILPNKMRNDVSGSIQKTASKKTTKRENLPRMWNSARSQECGDVFQRMCCKNSFAYDGIYQSQVRFGTNDRTQSHEESRNSSKGFENITSIWSSPTYARWQRETFAAGRIKACRNVVTTRLRTAVGDSDQSEQIDQHTAILQTGHGFGIFQDCDRSGRRFSQSLGAEGSGCEKRFYFSMSRVESVEVQKRANTDTTRNGFVYNFEVDEYNTYVANGIVVHNCHHYLAANQFGKTAALFTNARILGVTATPQRADGMGLGFKWDGIFDEMVTGPTMRQLINLGALSDYEIAIPDSDFVIDDAELAPSGDWSTAKMREASKKSHIVGDVVREYARRAFGKKFICFATDVETAVEMAANFNAAGISCAAVSAKTPAHTRNEMIRRFKNGQLLGLVNVDLFGEGFDVPAVEVVIMARPTASLAVYLQQFGRALRVLAGKAFGLVIDHVSNWKRHGFPDKVHPWTLARREKKSAKKDKDPEEIDLTACRECSRPYERCEPACPYCGAVPPLPDPVSRRPENVDGDLLLLTREMIAQMQAATELESPANMSQRVEAVAGRAAALGTMNRQMEKIAAQSRLQHAIAQWAAIERAKGREDAVTYRRFFLTTGMDVLSAQALDDRAAYDRLADQVEGWYSGD